MILCLFLLLTLSFLLSLLLFSKTWEAIDEKIAKWIKGENQ